MAWRAAGLPIVGNSGPRLSIFRQVQLIDGAMVALLVLAGFACLTVAFAIAGIMGAMLAFAGATDWCGLAMLRAALEPRGAILMAAQPVAAEAVRLRDATRHWQTSTRRETT
ncbi:hypothetical protein [Bosea sp. TAF32]|uniref:hypothetical protein n=1 Tax=Bosea sp. TAF32 TaxID=3237482 RepID=UPI003F92FF2B